MTVQEGEAVPATVEQPTSPAVSEPATQTQQPDDFQIRELTAQELIADATFWMAVAALFTFFVTTIGTILIWSQVRHTRRAVEGTNEAVKATREGNLIAEKSLLNAQEVARSDLRAWVEIQLELVDCARQGPSAWVSVNVALKNIGKTPALRVDVTLAIRVIPSVVVDYGELPVLGKTPHELGVLMPGADREQTFGLRLEPHQIEAGVTEAKKSRWEPIIEIDAVAYYHTVFDVEDAPKRLTSTRYHMVHNISHESEFRSVRMNWLDSDGPASPDKVKFGHDKSAPTYLT